MTLRTVEIDVNHETEKEDLKDKMRNLQKFQKSKIVAR